MTRRGCDVCLTFDLDFTDYVSGVRLDELEAAFPLIQNVLTKRPELSTTWFIRIDAQIERVYGAADYFATTHADTLAWLRSHGHEIGWHYHPYRAVAGEWVQNTDEQTIADELRQYAALARRHVGDSIRMGWGFHTNETMKTVESLGFRIDSSAVPRPRYRWELSEKDWTTTGQTPYYPSVADYRVAGTPRRRILEIPISTFPLPAPSDTETGVVRYLNPAYSRQTFADGVSDYLDRHDLLVLVCHPYEILSGSREGRGGLLAFDPAVFEANVLSLPNSRSLAQVGARMAG